MTTSNYAPQNAPQSLAEYVKNLTLDEWVFAFGTREEASLLQRVPFSPWTGQIGLMRWSEGRSVSWIPKARQLGISEIAAEKSVKTSIESPGSQGVIISKTEDDAIYFLENRLIPKLKGLPAYQGIEFPHIVKNNKNFIELSNGSKIWSLPASNASGASRTLTWAIIDEAGGIDNNTNGDFALLYKNLRPTLEKAGKLSWHWIIGTSEPGSFFNRQLTRMYRGEIEKQYYFLSWQTDPKRDKLWRKKEMENYDSEADFNNQYPATMDDFFAARQGAVFPSFDSSYGGKHIQEFEPDFGFQYITAYDHGFTHKAAHIHTLYNPVQDMLYVFMEQIWVQTDVYKIAEDINVAIKSAPKRPVMSLADTQIFSRDARGAIADHFAKKDVRFNPAYKANEEASRTLLSERFTTGKILIHPSCEVTAWQLREYVWKSTGRGDAPVDKEDDTIDCLRYICAHIRQIAPEAPPPKKKHRGYTRIKAPNSSNSVNKSKNWLANL